MAIPSLLKGWNYFLAFALVELSVPNASSPLFEAFESLSQ